MASSFAQPFIPPRSRMFDSPSTPVPTIPASRPITKTYKAYFSQDEIEMLYARQRGQSSTTKAERTRQIACGMIDAIGLRIGFPRRVIATGQALYHRFHLYFPLTEFGHLEVSLSTLYVAAKLHDTLKKPRDLILASYAVRQPEMLKGRLALLVDPSSIDPKQLESERRKMLSIERLVLETLCFNFMVGAEGGGSPGLDAFGLVIKLGRRAGYRRKFIYTSWKMIIDSYRTTASLSFTPQAICVSSFYATALLHSPPPDMPPQAELDKTGMSEAEIEMAEDVLACRRDVNAWQRGSLDTWLQDLSVAVNDIHDIVHLLLDLHVFLLQSASRPTITGSELTLTPSFGTPISPSDMPQVSSSQPSRSALSSSALGMHPQMIPALALPSRYNWTQERLMQLKIWLREQYKTLPLQTANGNGHNLDRAGEVKELNIETLTSGFGRNDETIRFLFC